MVSDRTPWQADAEGALMVLSLEERASWTRAIEAWGKLDGQALQRRRTQAEALADAYLSSDDAANAHRQYFRSVLAATVNPAR